MRFLERLFSRKSDREAVDPVGTRVLDAAQAVKRAANLLEQTIKETLDHNDMLRDRARSYHVQKSDPKHHP